MLYVAIEVGKTSLERREKSCVGRGWGEGAEGEVLGALEYVIDAYFSEEDVACDVSNVGIIAVEELLLHFFDLRVEI